MLDRSYIINYGRFEPVCQVLDRKKMKKREKAFSAELYRRPHARPLVAGFQDELLKK